MDSMFTKFFDNADEVKTSPKTHAATIKLGDISATKIVLEPGWKWSECVKPAVGGDSCQAGHDGWVIGDEVVVGYEFSDSGKDFGPWRTSS